MEVTGIITKIMPIKEGVSKSGKEWKSMDFLLDSKEKFNNIYCFTLFGTEKVDNFLKYNNLSDNVNVQFNVNTKEFDGRYFTSLGAWIIKKQGDKLPLQETKVDDSEVLPF